MSALLLIVVVLGICVAAVVVDLVGGPEQPATASPRHHREYGAGPWRNWLLALEGLVQRTAGRIQRAAVATGTTLRRWGRQLLAATKETIEAGRESWEGIAARRRAVNERQAAHARHVAHVEEVTESPEPYPLPPPLHELEEHEERLRREKEQWEGEIAAAQALAAPPAPTRLPDSVPGYAPGPERSGTADVVAAPARTFTGSALRERIGQPAPYASRRAVLPAPPTATRIRSAILLVAMMSALGGLVTVMFLGVIFVLVHALSSV